MLTYTPLVRRCPRYQVDMSLRRLPLAFYMNPQWWDHIHPQNDFELTEW